MVKTSPERGSWNMAVDEALLQSVGSGMSLPVLRLYAWKPACLSLGIAQPVADIDFKRLSSKGWDWVRRPTGGRAILHTDELTYSVTAPLSEPRLAGSVLESYLRLSKALLRGLTLLGLPAESQSKIQRRSGLAQEMGPVCFEVPSAYEITSGGKKLIGSAQARRREGILQHGSLPLYGDLSRINSVLVYTDEVSRQVSSANLLDHAVTLEDALGLRVSWEDAADTFVKAFAETLDLEFIPTELSADELALAESICSEKYSSSTWNARI